MRHIFFCFQKDKRKYLCYLNASYLNRAPQEAQPILIAINQVLKYCNKRFANDLIGILVIQGNIKFTKLNGSQYL